MCWYKKFGTKIEICSVIHGKSTQRGTPFKCHILHLVLDHYNFVMLSISYIKFVAEHDYMIYSKASAIYTEQVPLNLTLWIPDPL